MGWRVWTGYLDPKFSMAKIPEITEQKIKDAAKIADVLADLGVQLRRSGPNLVGLCPFHQDKSVGSFVVNEAKNICSCYSCGKVGIGPVDAVMELEKKTYPEALRWIADRYNIYIDEQSDFSHHTIHAPRMPAPQLPIITWLPELVTAGRKRNGDNVLLKYLLSLPLSPEHRAALERAIHNYCVGTDRQGRTIWWYLNPIGYITTGKVMTYKADGHRDKDVDSTWTHYLMQKWKVRNGVEWEDPKGTWDNHTHRVEIGIFGLHFVDIFPKAVIRIVESEKTAVFCSAFTPADKVVWMAVGGESRLTGKVLQPLLDRKRTIELYPDYDGIEKWTSKIAQDKILSEYPRISVSPQVKQLWRQEDGPKADIADIMMRVINTTKNLTPLEMMIEQNPAVGDMIQLLGLKQV